MDRAKWLAGPIGAAAALLGLGHDMPSPLVPGGGAAEVDLWVADRGADRLYGLDRDLLVACSIEVGAPVALEAGSDGGLWMISARRSGPPGVHEAWRRSPAAVWRRVASCGPVLDSAAGPAGSLLVIEGGSGRWGQDRLLALEPSGRKITLFEAPGLRAVAAAGTKVLLGAESGELFETSALAPGVPRRRTVPGSVLDLAPGPRPGTWWVLHDARPTRLALLDAGGAGWEVDAGMDARRLAPVAGEERVWVFDHVRPRARRFGPAGRIERDRGDLPLRGFTAALARPRGGVLLAAPGALLRLDGRAALLPGQGGFGFLVATVAARGVSGDAAHRTSPGRRD